MGPHLWERVSVRHFAAVPACVRDARRHAAGLVQAWGLADVADSTELLVSELAANAAQASGNADRRQQAWQGGASRPVRERMALRLTCAATTLVIEMWDGSATPPVCKTPDPDDEGGRGLLLVEALSQDWGYYRPWAGGKVVWCALRLTEAPFSPAGGWAGPSGPPDPPRHRHPETHPETPPDSGPLTGLPADPADDLARLRRVIDGLRALGGWYLPVDDDIGDDIGDEPEEELKDDAEDDADVGSVGAGRNRRRD